MDICKQIDNLLLKHIEKTLSTDEARRLAKHVLECESCREYYLAFDEAAEYAETMEMAEAPANFTSNVMLAVSQIQPVVAVRKRFAYKVEMALTWGLSLLLLAIIVFLAYNPDYFLSLANVYPMLAVAAGVMLAIGDFFMGLGQWFAQQAVLYGSENLFGIAALVFMFISGSLLFVLQKEEEKSLA